jgi:hypothetical protein
LSETFFILGRTELNVIKMCIGLDEKYRYSFQILMKIDFFKKRFSKNTQISNFVKIRSVRAELFHADRRTEGWTDGRRDVTKLIVAVCNLAKTLTIGTSKYPYVMFDKFGLNVIYYVI